MKKHDYSIRKRVVVFSSIVIFISLVILGFSGYYMYSLNTKNITVTYSKQILNPLKQQVERTLKEYDRLMIPVWLNNDVQDIILTPSENWLENPRKIIRIKESIRNIFGWQDSIEGLYIYTKDGGNISGVTSNQIAYRVDFQNDEFYNSSKGLQDSIVIGPYQNNNLNNHLKFSILKPLRSVPTFEWHGVLQLDISVDKVLQIFKSFDVGKDGYIFAFDSNGHYIYHPNENKIGNKVDSKILTNISNQKSGSITINNEKADQLFIFESSDYLNWTFVSVVPKKEINLGALTFLNFFIFFGCISIIIISLFLWKMNQIMLSPLNIINEAMRELEKGNFDSTIPTPSIIELKSFTEGYNRTLSRLKNLTESLYITKLKQQKSEIEAQKHLILKQQAEIHQREAELSRLEAQINPHFLYNTLSCIQGLAELEEFSEIDRVVGLLSKLFRYTLSQGQSKVTVREELEHVKVFVDIQNVRYEDSIEVLWDIDELVLDKEINRLTIQPLVENAYFHGVEPYAGKGKIKISVKKIVINDTEKLKLCVEDNGIGMDELKLAEIKSFIELQKNNKYYDEVSSQSKKRLSGIKNVIKRLFLVYGEECEIKIESKNGTKILITIPY